MRRELGSTGSRSIILMVVLLISWPCVSLGEVFEVKVGTEETSAVSSSYFPKAESAIQLEATYSRPFSGRWSIFGQYQINASNTLSGGFGGISFDSEDRLAKGGSISADGISEIIRQPIWMMRTSFGFGVVKYVNSLNSTDDNLGDLNTVPVQADLYCLKFAFSLIHFLNPTTGISLSGSYAAGSAGAFGVSSVAVTTGIFYQPN